MFNFEYLNQVDYSILKDIDQIKKGAFMKINGFCSLIFMVFFSGCVAAPFLIAPIVTGVIMWQEGEATKYYHEKPAVLYRATKTSLKELELELVNYQSEKNTYNLNVGQGEDDRFKITVSQVKPNISVIKIRVNFMGDKPFAELLYNQIDLNMNAIEFDDQGKPTKKRFRGSAIFRRFKTAEPENLN